MSYKMFSKEYFQNKSSMPLFLKGKGLCGRIKHCILSVRKKNKYIFSFYNILQNIIFEIPNKTFRIQESEDTVSLLSFSAMHGLFLSCI